MKRAVAAAGLVGLAVAGTASCSAFGDKANEPFSDAPRTGIVNREPADVIEMPDGFSNLATKCDHGNRIYVAYHGNSSYATVGVVAKDPTCA